MKIKRFDPSKKKEGENVFYIQSHGFNAGKPLKKPKNTKRQITGV